ncbi:hypothetical protein T12_6862 [Trichinella patagoniensis]|uniref:Uncharacterized protein n=1 Tax=Trichinella patagoniensis TaxID=990121 RepID=A0A0V0YP88_9BILA|nr:hypothetical protein T12_6862 [Trichinella patagoniensis]
MPGQSVERALLSYVFNLFINDLRWISSKSWILLFQFSIF